MNYKSKFNNSFLKIMNDTSKKVIKRDSIKKSSIFNIAIKLFTYLIPLILSPYLYRTLSFEGMGTYEFQYAYVSYFILIASFGFDSYGTKKISASTNNVVDMSKQFWNILNAKIFLGISCLILYFALVFSGVFGGKQYYPSYSILSIFIVSTMLDISFFYQGIEKFKGVALRTLIVKLLNLIFIFVFVKSENDYIKYIVIMSCSYLIASLVMFLPLRKYIYKPTFDKKLIIADLKGSSLFFISALAISLYTTMQKTVLGLLTNELEVGYFSSAMKIKDVVTAFAYAIITVYLSRISFLIAVRNKEEALSKTYTCFNVVYDLTIPATFGLICISNVFMPLYFGNGGSNAILMMILIAISIPFISTSAIITNVYLVPNNKQNKANIVYLSAAVFNFIITYILVITFKGNGAALAATITEIFVAIFCIHYSKKFINYKKVLNDLSKPLLASIIMALFYFTLDSVLTKFISANKAMVILIFLSMILYVALMILFKDKIVYSFYKKIKTDISNFFNKLKAKKKSN